MNISATFPERYLRSRAQLTLGLSPRPSGLNRKCIKGLYLETQRAVFREQPQFFRLPWEHNANRCLGAVIRIHYLLGLDGVVGASRLARRPRWKVGCEDNAASVSRRGDASQSQETAAEKPTRHSPVGPEAPASDQEKQGAAV